MAETRLRRNVKRHIPTISINDRPLFMQNGNPRRFSTSTSTNTTEIGNFRRALPQFIAVSIKNILLFGYGMTLGFPTIVIPAIQGGDGRATTIHNDDIVLNREEISWFSSINLICVPLGCLFSGMLTQPIGKRKAMQFVNLPILASWLLFHFSSKTEHLYAALCLSGLGGGLMEAPVLTYVAEITEPKYRGILSALGSTCVITGVFIQFIMISLMDWRTIAAVSSACPIIAIIALSFVPESPTWLIREHRYREAVKSLQWLRGWVEEHKIEDEFNRLYEELITQPALEEARENPEEKPSKVKTWLRMFRKRSFLVPFLLVAFTFFTGHFSGKTPLQTYAVQIFHTLKAPINKYHATILLGVAELIATILCVFLIHFTGKRPLVMISTIGVGICFFGTATYAHYLKVVPGFAINNVVINASSIVSKENIISQGNITNIFEKEGQALFHTTVNGDDMESTTVNINQSMLYADNEEIALNRTRRDSELSLHNDGFIDNLTFTDLSVNRMINQPYAHTTTLFNLSDSEEDEEITTEDSLIYRDSRTQANTDGDDVAISTIKPVYDAVDKTKLPSEVTEKGQTSAVQDILVPVPKQEKNNWLWLPLMLLLGSAFFAHCGIRMIPWILIGEVFPAPVRSTASGLVSGLGYIFGFLANKLFLQMLSTFTMPGTFWFYSAVAFSGAIILYFTLPETEGRTLAEIEAHFSKKSDVNLLSKAYHEKLKQQGATITPSTAIQFDHLQNLQMPISPHTEAKIIQLQQNDALPIGRSRPENNGETNFAYQEDNNTTHL